MDLGVLCKSGLTDTLTGQCVLLERSCEWVLSCAGMLLLKQLAAGQGGAGDGMIEGLWLWLRRWRSCESGLSFGGRGRGGKEVDLLADGTA